MKNQIKFLMICFIFANLTLAQQYKSIHQLESEHYKAHRLLKSSSPGNAEDIIPLNKTIHKNLSHTVFGFYPYWGGDF